MPSSVVAFAVPNSVTLEAEDGGRSTADVTHFEGGCIWVYLRRGADLSYRASLRLVFRQEGEASLGMGGVVIWSANGRIAIEVQHPVDRSIVRQWSRGLAADVSEFVRLDRTELPTAEYAPLQHAGMMIRSEPTLRNARPSLGRRSDASVTSVPMDEAMWVDGDTVDEQRPG